MNTTETRQPSGGIGGSGRGLSNAKRGLLSRLLSPFSTSRSNNVIARAGGNGLYKNQAVAASAGPYAMPQAYQQAMDQESTTTTVGTVQTQEVRFEVDLGFPRNIEEKYNWGRELGKGGNGVVRIVVDKETGVEYACKSILKVLEEGSDKKKAGHVDSLKREIGVLTKLKGSLNIVKLEDVYEDSEYVHIIQECCKGGELWHRIGEKHYSERTVGTGALCNNQQPFGL